MAASSGRTARGGGGGRGQTSTTRGGHDPPTPTSPQSTTHPTPPDVELYKLKRNVPMSVEACAPLTANILSGSRYYPYWVQLVIGGWDRSGGHVFSIDAAGGALPRPYTSSGSGGPVV